MMTLPISAAKLSFLFEIRKFLGTKMAWGTQKVSSCDAYQKFGMRNATFG